MAFKYGTTSPTEIIYNGTSLTVLKYGDEAVWGKPYTLSISQGPNTTVTVNRTSSPNQQAETGVLSDGSIIYYGDVLTITYTVASNYKIDTHTINGNDFNSGQSVTVDKSLSIVTTAVASASWHTIWTGSKSVTSNTLITTTDKLPLQFKATLTTTNETWQTDWTNVVTVNTSQIVYVQGDNEGDYVENCGEFKITIAMEGLKTKIYATFSGRTGEQSGEPYTMMITKLEGYY